MFEFWQHCGLHALQSKRTGLSSISLWRQKKFRIGSIGLQILQSYQPFFLNK